MSIGPVSGNSIVLTSIPGQKIVWCSAVCQAANTQNVILKDSSGNTVFSASGNSTSPKQFGFGTFTSNGNNYTLTINSSAGQSMVLYDYDTLTLGTNIYLGYYTFIAEDGTDKDYNDTYLTIAWFLYAG
jgi:hypothetical protein